MADLIKIEFTKEKETTGTIRYKEDSEEPKVGFLYLKKQTYADLGDPQKLTITIEGV